MIAALVAVLGVGIGAWVLFGGDSQTESDEDIATLPTQEDDQPVTNGAGGQAVARGNAGSAAAASAALPQQGNAFGNWNVVCQKAAQGAQACFANAVLRDDDNRPQLAVSISAPRGQPPLSVATIMPPWGVSLPNGVEIQLDEGNVYRVPFYTCMPSGCRAEFRMVDSFQADMQEAKRLRISMLIDDSRQLRATVDLAGYRDAYGQLLERSKR